MSPIVTMAQSPMTSDNLMLLYNSQSDDSRHLMDVYADLRNIPKSRCIEYAFPKNETLDRNAYNRAAAHIRQILTTQPWGNQIRCIVTFYDVPLKIGPRLPAADDAKNQTVIRKRLEEALNVWHQTLTQLEASWPGIADRPNDKTAPPSISIQKLIEQYVALRRELAGRLETMTEEDRTKGNRLLLDAIAKIEGQTALIPLVASNASDSEAGPLKAEALNRQSMMARNMILKARQDPANLSSYDQAVTVAVQWFGLMGVANIFDEDIHQFDTADTHASFDSELSMVLQESHNLYRWQINMLSDNAINANMIIQDANANNPSAKARPAMMVARIDAPTPQLAERMLRDAWAIEQSGLKGNAYIDARGLKKNDLYTTYDRDLIDLYYLMQDRPDIHAILDVQEKVFDIGTCPDAALYCGWYSVARYVPAFTFKRGAVAVHIASFEAVSLHHASKPYWCPQLISNGVAATFGPTAEPYLHTFPKPTLFFGLIMTGQYTLAECYYRAKPFNSWQFTLLGDPLYRPFAKNPQLTEDALNRYLLRNDNAPGNTNHKPLMSHTNP